MAKIPDGLKTILKRYDINPNDTSKVWNCHGTLVLYHKAYEIIAAQENITFDAPVIVESAAKDKIAVIMVTGHLKDNSAWSFGEAMPINNKNAYPYSMAEKRAKDRVVSKLVGLAEYVYSEDEADDFKAAKGTQQKAQEPDEKLAKASEFATKAQTDILSLDNIDDLTTWQNDNKAWMSALEKYPALISGLNKAINAQYDRLG